VRKQYQQARKKSYNINIAAPVLLNLLSAQTDNTSLSAEPRPGQLPSHSKNDRDWRAPKILAANSRRSKSHLASLNSKISHADAITSPEVDRRGGSTIFERAPAGDLA
jgi:hypothetical protein